MSAVSEKQRNSRAATLERSRRGLRKDQHFRCFRVLTLLLYSHNIYLERFGLGYVRISLIGFANYHSMNRYRLLEDFKLLEKMGLVNHVTLYRGKVLFQVEKPLWNEKSQHSNAIQDLQKSKGQTPM